MKGITIQAAAKIIAPENLVEVEGTRLVKRMEMKVRKTKMIARILMSAMEVRRGTEPMVQSQHSWAGQRRSQRLMQGRREKVRNLLSLPA